MCWLLEPTLYLQALAKWLDLLFINQKTNSSFFQKGTELHKVYCATKITSFVLDFFVIPIIYGLISIVIAIFGDGNTFLPSFSLLNFPNI